ncbi:hypothetical protein [Kitasatospora aureofaciens]|uniref:hypothetical protein n=1 Tax=Kitasatospora aureofaciens TaxID=1894 RepID=UPI00340AC0C4
MTTDEELLRHQAALQAEADAVHADLGLDTRLGALGTPVRVGGSALGLMVRRDLDVTVVCPRLDTAAHERVAALGARLAVHERVRQVRLRNDTGAWNEDPDAYPDGLYLGPSYRSPASHSPCPPEGRDWTLDLWFVDDPARQPDLAHLRELPPTADPAGPHRDPAHQARLGPQPRLRPHRARLGRLPRRPGRRGAHPRGVRAPPPRHLTPLTPPRPPSPAPRRAAAG